jgi:GNAT superfamily N-acetyltransferase
MTSQQTDDKRSVAGARPRAWATIPAMDPHANDVRTPPGIAIRRLHAVDDAQIEGLADLLIDSIDGGASVGFMHPLAPAKAQAFWRRVADGVAGGGRALLVAEDEAGIVGTVQLVLDLPENQPHRADLVKMLVHRRARRRGLGAALMWSAEQLARDCDRTLLVLDTVTGSDAERLYTRMGWTRVGEIPDFALLSRGGLTPTTFFFKRL